MNLGLWEGSLMARYLAQGAISLVHYFFYIERYKNPLNLQVVLFSSADQQLANIFVLSVRVKFKLYWFALASGAIYYNAKFGCWKIMQRQ